MRVLVGCEESQAVTAAFRAAGHEAYSCDVSECSGGHPEWHLQKDVFEAIHADGPWDLLIAFPPCTHLSAAGARYWAEKQADGRQQEAVDFVRRLWGAPVPRVAIENPTGWLNTHWRKPAQILHPYFFGDPWTKRLCLWLRGLPLLEPTDVVEPQWAWSDNSWRGGVRKDGTRPKNRLPCMPASRSSRHRSKTAPGVARAMAAQWTDCD